MNILVVGSTSTIARALQARLSQLGKVHTAGRRKADVFIDLAEWQVVPEPSHKFDVVIHVAADFGGSNDDDFVRAEVVNVAGTLTVCRLAQKAKARHLILISTISAGYAEDNPYFDGYALSKRHAEESARLYCRQNGIALTILRPTQVFDMAGECRQHQPLLYSIADHAENGEDIVIYGRHDAIRNYIFLDDLVEIVARTVETKTEGTFCCANPRSVRLSEVAKAAFASFAKGGELRFDTSKPNLADVQIVNDNSLYQRIGFTPEVDIDAGMFRIRAYRNTCGKRDDGQLVGAYE